VSGRFTKIKTHRDGTVSYCSEITKKWVCNVGEVPEKELFMMTMEEQLRLVRFLEKHKSKRC